MYQSQTGIAYIIVGGIPEIVRQCVYQCPAIIPVSGVYDQSCRFVDNQDGFVFVYDIERYVLGYDLEFVSGSIHDDRHDIERLYAIVRLDRFPVYENTASFGCLLYPVTGRTFETCYEKFIYS